MKDLLMGMLKNKEKILETIFKDMDTCAKNMSAFEKLEKLFNEGKEVNPEQVMKATSKSLRHLNELNRRMLLIMVVLVSSDDFSSDLAKVLIKLGSGQDALKEMFRQKMNGK